MSQQAKRISAHYRDQPLTPLQTAVYWIEYVIRHRGALHLRSASMDLNFWQYHALDVFAILAGWLLVSLVAFALLLRVVWRRYGSRQRWGQACTGDDSKAKIQ